MDLIFLVEFANGPAYDKARARREQRGWAEHAQFIDALHDRGIVALGGPVGRGDGDRVLLIVRAPDAQTAREHIADDPWYESILRLESIRLWNLWVGALPPTHPG